MRATSGLVHQRAEVQVYNSYACKETKSHAALFSELREVPEQFPLSCRTHTDTRTQVVQMCKGNKALIHCFTKIKEKIFVYFSEIGLQEFPGNQQRNPVVGAAVLSWCS